MILRQTEYLLHDEELAAGHEPGPEGAICKLVASRVGHEMPLKTKRAFVDGGRGIRPCD